MNIPSLLDAVRVAKENEKIASSSYADASREIKNEIGKILFEELSKFEMYHYEQLTLLENSLEASGDFVDYQGKEFPIPPIFAIKAAQEPNTKSVMRIISEAIDLEKIAEATYSDLAKVTTDPQGFDMFTKLSEEEHKHFRLLTEAYWTLNNFGVWKYERP